MANYQLISEDDNHQAFIVKSSGFLETLKLVWYVLRYPNRVPVLMVIDKDWCNKNLEPGLENLRQTSECANESRTPAANGSDHDCFRCAQEWDLAHPDEVFPVAISRMWLCPVCGNKRCPKATDHRQDCTGSNDIGQPGSRY